MERREDERVREQRKRMARSGSGSYRRNVEEGARPRDCLRSRERRCSESMARGEAGLFARQRKVFTDGGEVSVQVDNSSRDREDGGRRRIRVSGSGNYSSFSS